MTRPHGFSGRQPAVLGAGRLCACGRSERPCPRPGCLAFLSGPLACLRPGCLVLRRSCLWVLCALTHMHVYVFKEEDFVFSVFLCPVFSLFKQTKTRFTHFPHPPPLQPPVCSLYPCTCFSVFPSFYIQVSSSVFPFPTVSVGKEQTGKC